MNEEVYHRICAECNTIIIYKNRAAWQTSISRNKIVRCKFCAMKHTPQVAHRRERKVALGLDPDRLFLERICPQCQTTKITYTIEKSALNAEEEGRICRSCVNRNYHTIPGNTTKRMKNAMTAAHNTNGVSKLELSIIDILAAFGFIHSTQSELTIGRYTPDFINEECKCIIEVYGDYWHCHPDLFPDPNTIVSQLNKTAGEQRQRNKDREAFYTQMGYNPIVLWERDIRQFLTSYSTDLQQRVPRVSGLVKCSS